MIQNYLDKLLQEGEEVLLKIDKCILQLVWERMKIVETIIKHRGSDNCFIATDSKDVIEEGVKLGLDPRFTASLTKFIKNYTERSALS